MTIRNRRGLSLAEQRSDAQKQASFTNKVFNNAGRLLNRLAAVAEIGKLTPPAESGQRGSVTLNFTGDRQEAIKRIEKVLRGSFENNRMENVQFSRIRLDVVLRQKRQSRRRRAA